MPIFTKPLPQLTPQEIERFWSYVDKRGPDECWPWTAAVNSRYGVFTIRTGYQFKAQRIAYFLHYGEDPEPLLVCHHCDNPICCNGKHLFKGTCKDNVDDCVTKGRRAYGERHWTKIHPERLAKGDRHWSVTTPEKLARGEAHYSAKLTAKEVRKIRKLFATGVRYARLAEQFHVRRQSIRCIILGTTWKHV